MLAFYVAGLAPVLWTIGIAFVATFVLITLAELLDARKRQRPYDRMLRERRRDARRTAHVMRRMSAIRRETAERMDRAEEEGWR